MSQSVLFQHKIPKEIADAMYLQLKIEKRETMSALVRFIFKSYLEYHGHKFPDDILAVRYGPAPKEPAQQSEPEQKQPAKLMTKEDLIQGGWHNLATDD